MSQHLLTDTLIVVGISYKKTDTQTRGLFNLSEDQQFALIDELKALGGSNILVISTCNRTEIYCSDLSSKILLKKLSLHSGGPINILKEIAFEKSGNKAVHHLFNVGCGLDSQIIGDVEIIGQVKKSYLISKRLEVDNSFLDRLINAVIKASKRIKSKTELSSGATSVSFSGVQYIRENVRDLSEKKIVLFGLGKMGRNTCENLVKHSKHSSITLINRNVERAEVLGHKYKVVSKGISELQTEIEDCDILFVATGAQYHTVTKQMLKRRKPILILDLSMPRNVDPAAESLSGVQLLHIDALSALANKSLSDRLKHLPSAKAIVKKQQEEFFEWVYSRKYVPVLNALNCRLKGFKDTELDKLFKEVDENHHSGLMHVTDKLVQKITGQIANHLRNNSQKPESELEALQDIFQLQKVTSK